MSLNHDLLSSKPDYENHWANNYHNNHGIGDSFHDHDHVLVHEFRTVLHSLQGMTQIQLGETGDFSSKAHYFVQQEKNTILIQSIL